MSAEDLIIKIQKLADDKKAIISALEDKPRCRDSAININFHSGALQAYTEVIKLLEGGSNV